MKIIKQEKVPTDAKICGKVDCHCNHCKKKTFHFLYEKGTENYIKCFACGESFQVEFEAMGTA